MYTLEQLSAVWHWAKANTNAPHSVIDQHLKNMEDALNNGQTVIPMLDFDTDRTLTRHSPPEDNNDLFQFGKLITENTDDGIWRQMTVCSEDMNMALKTAQRLDDQFCSVASKREIHPYSADNEYIREMLIDDQGDLSRYKDRYATVVIPTWDNGLIAFPKPK